MKENFLKSPWEKWKFWPLAWSAEAAAAAAGGGLVIGAGGETASPGLKGWGSRVIIAGPAFQDNKVFPLFFSYVVEWFQIYSFK